MEPKNLVLCAMITVGATLGVFFKLRTSGVIISTILILSVAGSVGAAFLQLIQAEWLLLLIGAVPAAGILFGAAVLSNVLLSVVRRLLGNRQDRG